MSTLIRCLRGNLRRLYSAALFAVVFFGCAQIQSLASTSVNLAWNPSPSADVYAYNVYYGTESGVYNNSITVYYATDAAISDLAVGTTNYFAVSAIDIYGNESPLSNEVAYVVPVPDSIVLQAQGALTSRSVNLTWNPSPNADVYAYNVYYGTESGVYNNSITVYYATDAVISDLAVDATNYFAVSAIDVYGNESPLSNEAAYVVPIPDSVVLQAQGALTSQSVNLAWNPSPSADVCAYNVYYGTESGVYNNSITVYYATDAAISDLAVGTTNYFTVSAIDIYGNESTLSNEAAYVVPIPDSVVLQTQTLTDDGGQPFYLLITAAGAVNGLWEIDYSTDLQNWYAYQYGYGYGTGDDVYTYVWLDPSEPQMFFRLINYY